MKSDFDMADDIADLVTWLRVWLDEDEQRIRHAHGPDGDSAFYGLNDELTDEDRAERMRLALGGVAAKRLILRYYDLVAGRLDEMRRLIPEGPRAAEAAEAAMADVVRALASEYVDRPGYRKEWRPA